MLPRSALAKTRTGLIRLASRASVTPIALQPRPALSLSSRSIITALQTPSRLTSANARWYASTAVAEKPEEEDDFFASAPVASSSSAAAQVETGQIDDPGPSSSSSSDAAPVRESTPFTSLKGRVDKDVLKALTVKPFQLKAMSEVQKRVLTLMPELSGGKPKSSAVSEDEIDGDEEVLLKNVLGQKVSTKARGQHDLLVKAKTGTGKTIAFLVPAIESRLNQLKALSADKNSATTAKGSVGAIIISPTRELATQIANEAMKVCTWHRDFGVKLFVGGMSRYAQLNEFRRNRKDILVATPGRMKDMLSEPIVRDALAETPTLILDEADTLLEMGFAKDLNEIISSLPKERQTFLFSATVSPEIRSVARKSLKPDHQFIDCVPKNETNVHTHIPQYYTQLASAADQIPETLKLIAQDQMENPDSKVILFLPTTKATMLWATILRELNDTLPERTQVHEIHSQLDQRRRSRASDNFRRDKRPSVLVTSDVSARGVDYPGVTRVIQVGVPSSGEQYIHRVGRTGRGGKSGGRGDLVLLPFESGFVDELHKTVPIKPVEPGSTARSLAPLFSPEQLASIDERTRALLPSLDPEAIREVYTSFIGYYLGRSDTLRKSGQQIYQGLQEWSTGAAGLEEPPFLSEAFLNKLGLSSKSKPKFGRSGSGGRGFGGGQQKRTPFGVRSGGRDNDDFRGGGGFRSRDRDTAYGSDRRDRDRGAEGERRDRHDRPARRFSDNDGPSSSSSFSRGSKPSWSDRGKRAY